MENHPENEGWHDNAVCKEKIDNERCYYPGRYCSISLDSDVKSKRLAQLRPEWCIRNQIIPPQGLHSSSQSFLTG